MLKEFLHRVKRVLQVARKPDKEEYLNVAKITAIGLTIIGSVGYIIQFVRWIIEEMI